jgi:hypothetical protein
MMAGAALRCWLGDFCTATMPSAWCTMMLSTWGRGGGGRGGANGAEQQDGPPVSTGAGTAAPRRRWPDGQLAGRGARRRAGRGGLCGGAPHRGAQQRRQVQRRVQRACPAGGGAPEALPVAGGEARHGPGARLLLQRAGGRLVLRGGLDSEAGGGQVHVGHVGGLCRDGLGARVAVHLVRLHLGGWGVVGSGARAAGGELAGAGGTQASRWPQLGRHRWRPQWQAQQPGCSRLPRTCSLPVPTAWENTSTRRAGR